MAELLLELFSEEIPARMQARAAADLKRLMADVLQAQGVAADEMKTLVTPRRLVLTGTGLALRTPDLMEERRGPRADAPDKAVEGFLSATGLTRDRLETRQTPKGAFLYANVHRKGQPTADVLAQVIPQVVRDFPWPKAMRWGARSAAAGALRWVRPLQSVICLLDGKLVEFDIDGVTSGNWTRGHRFHSDAPFKIESIEDYGRKMRRGSVVADPAERAEMIAAGAAKLAEAAGLELIEDAALLAENAGLTEYPVPLLGRFDAAFLDVPPEVIQLTMRANQKYFALREAATGKLANAFICVSNLQAQDGGKAIIAGNEKVLAARLSDAKFFWDQDRKGRLDDLLPKLAAITFHEKLGTQADRVERVARLARHVAQFIPGCDADMAERAARLAKADLVSAMVFEFPELQGVMGRYYALAQGEPAQVAQAIAEHYSPLGPSDDCPTAPVSIAVALADKLDTLVGFFTIDEKPTGSKDPFALRRAALGVIRLVLENGLRASLRDLFEAAAHPGSSEAGAALSDFFADRLKVQQKEAGTRHDIIEAVISLGGEDDLVRLLARVAALQTFVGSDDGANLLAGYTRAANILRIEEKKDGRAYDGPVDVAALVDPAERALADVLDMVEPATAKALAAEDFTGAMAALARLRGPVDAYFEQVTVNAEDAGLRANRLNMLARIRATMHGVADFSKIEG